MNMDGDAVGVSRWISNLSRPRGSNSRPVKPFVGVRSARVMPKHSSTSAKSKIAEHHD